MALHTIVLVGDPILRQKAQKIRHFEPSLRRLANDMFETMHHADGVGLAAPQIGLPIRLFVAEYTDEQTGKHYKLAMANPDIVKAEGEQQGIDGCLSMPGYYGINVRRALRVVVKGQDLQGKPMRYSVQGRFAWVLQHEIDHLNGILYTDRLDRPEDLRRISEEDLEAARQLSDGGINP